MKKITIIGVGALGSHLVFLLRNEKATIRIVDFDRVEMKNVASQFHWKGNVGKKKVEALKQSMQFAYGCQLEIIGNRLTDDNADQLLGGADLLVDCLDNGASRRIVQAFAKKHTVACLHGALAANGEFGRVVWTENFTVDDESGAGAPTCEDGEFLPFISVVASYLAFAAQRFLRDNARISFSIWPGGVQKI